MLETKNSQIFFSSKKVLLSSIYFQDLPCLHDAKERLKVSEKHYHARKQSLVGRCVSFQRLTDKGKATCKSAIRGH